MVFYVIEPVSQPEILFACRTTNRVDKASGNIIDHRAGVIELAYCENMQGAMLVETEDCRYSLSAGELGLYMPDLRYVLRPAESAENLSVTSVAVRFSKMDYRSFETDDMAEIWGIVQKYPDALILPRVFSFSLSENAAEDLQILRSQIGFLINTYKEKSAAGKYYCISQWYKLGAEIDSCFRNAVRQHGDADMKATGSRISGAYYYVYKAKKYIMLHIGECIEPKAVSAYIGVSHPYFVKLFKKETGISLNEYIYRKRIDYFSSVLDQNSAQTIKTLAAECGFQDMRHLQRLFLLYKGISMQEYRKQGRGLTLYHTDPWQCKNNEEDLLKKDKL